MKSLRKLLNVASVLFVFFGNSAWAENVHFKSAPVDGQVLTGSLKLTDAQAVMSCHFDFRGSRKKSVRYPQTFLHEESAGQFSLKVRAGSLVEIGLPGFHLLSCSYKLILIGVDTKNNRSAFGDVFLLGQESGTMNEDELKDIQNPAVVSKVLAAKMKDLVLSVGEDGVIVESSALF